MTHALRRFTVVAAAAAAIAIVIAGCSSQAPTPHPSATSTPTNGDVNTESARVLYKGGLYVQKDSLAARAADALRATGDTTGVSAASAIASHSVAIWLGDQYDDTAVVAVVKKNLAAAEAAGTTPVFVTYAIPHRDCGDYSAGGWTAAQYPGWTKAIAETLKGHRAVVIVEPDALAMLSNCPAETDTRIPLVKQAVEQFAAAGVAAYLDAGNSHWVAPATMAARLKSAGVESARGFFTNVASFYSVTDEKAYASKLSKMLGGKHYVIDVSRNGQGWKGTWCNPTGAGLGQLPHVASGTNDLDALLWIKSPGISDGSCNGGPKAGVWFSSYAQALVKLRAH